MIHRLLLGWGLPVAFAVGLMLPPGVNADTKPGSPSYSDQWMQSSPRSSPFLELRNERDTGSPVLPDPPDTPEVEPVESPATDEQSPATVTETGDTEGTETSSESGSTEEKTESDDGTPDPSSSDNPEASSKKTGEPPAAGESTESKSSDRKSRSRRQEREAVTSMLSRLDPEEPSALSPSLESSSGTVTLHALSFSIPSVTAEPSEPPSGRPETAAWWWRYRYWLAGGLVVSLITGMFFWFRRRRVTVVERSYPSAEEFFGDNIKRPRSPEPESPDPRVRRKRTAETELQDEDQQEGPESTTTKPPESPTAELPTKSLTDVLQSYGIEDEHQTLVEMYYSKELTRREVADQSSLGEGEVGLVLDLADRIKEEAADGEGA